MSRFLIRRGLLALFVVFGVTLVTFVISHVVPADPVVAYLGDHAPPSLVAQVRAQLGLDRPLPEQYLIYLDQLSHGNLGISIMDQRPVGAL